MEAPPQIQPAVPPKAKTYAFADLTGLTKWVRGLLVLGALAAGISIIFQIMQLVLLSHGFTDAEASSNDQRQQAIAGAQTWIYLLTVLFFGIWIFRANKNVRALGADNLTQTPGWAVGYFFIPVLCLWKPYQAMKELWKSSQQPSSWQHLPSGQILPAWWGFWISANVWGRAVDIAMKDASTISGLKIATYFEIAADAMNIGLCVTALIVVVRIHSAQTRSGAMISGNV